jgi:hypothetical protein
MDLQGSFHMTDQVDLVSNTYSTIADSELTCCMFLHLTFHFSACFLSYFSVTAR